MGFAYLYPYLYSVLKRTFPTCLWNGSDTQKTIALTFDDGPHAEYTPRLLDVLDRYQIRGSFFCLGACVKRNPQLTKEIYQKGHWIGLHGYQHKSFPFLTWETISDSLNKTKEIISEVCDIEKEKLTDVRPPNGLITPKIIKHLEKNHYRVVMWSVVPEDWVNPGLTVVRSRILHQIHNGALIVLHDGYHGGSEVAKITEDLIPRLLQLKYRFVTVSDLWSQKIGDRFSN